YYDSARLRQRLHPRRCIGRIAVNLTRRVDHYRTSFNPDARVERRLASTRVFAVDLRERALDGKGGSCCAFSVGLLRHWITEQRHQPIAQLFGDVAAHLHYGSGGGIQIRADQIAPVLRIKPRGDAGRTNKIAEHHRDMSALANGFCDWCGSRRSSRWS